jgi:hypothetical protein
MSFDWDRYSDSEDVPAIHKNRLAILELKRQLSALGAGKSHEFRGWLAGRIEALREEPFGDREELMQDIINKFEELFGKPR